MRRFRFALGLVVGAVALLLADRRFGSDSGVGSTEPPGAEVPALPALERET